MGEIINKKSNRNQSCSRRRGRKNEGELPNSSSTAKGDNASYTKDTTYKPHNSLLITLDEGEPWYKFATQFPDRDAILQEGTTSDATLVNKYRNLADAVYRREVHLFTQEGNNNTKDDRWVESTMRNGTLKDRIASMSVVVSNNPVHKFYALDGLLQMAGCSPNDHHNSQPNSRVAQLAADAVEDLFLNTFLPPDRKLKTMAQRPLTKYEHTGLSSAAGGKKKTKKTLSPRILLLWRFEEKVKEKYDLFLRQYLAHTLHAGTMETQKTAALHSAATLLRLVPEGESLLLPMLVNKLGDPSKKVASAVAHELRRILQQHPVMGTVIAREVQQLAHRPRLAPSALYHAVTFLNQLKLIKEEDKGNKSLAASLISTYFRLFEVAIQKSKEKTTQDPEGSMKTRLLSALLTGVNRAHPYLSKTDQTLEEHVDALYRVVHTAPSGARTQSLLLLFHLAVGATDPNIGDHSNVQTPDQTARKDRFYRALFSTLALPEMLRSGKHLTMFFNLLYKAIKYDTDTTQQVAFGKRILATALHCSAATFIACLFLIHTVGQAHPILLTCYTDILTGNDALRVLDPSKREPRGALIIAMEGDDNSLQPERINTEHRAPGWEVALATHHYHPSVQKFAQSMGNSENSLYTGDPLKDFALAQFLDKFAYRNPKSTTRSGDRRDGSSVAERRRQMQQVTLPVNDPSFWQRTEKSVEVHEDFFYKFFVERAKRDLSKGIDRHKVDKKNDDKNKDEELEALEKVEEELDGRNFADFENEWESDEDEEAFVDSLAQKIIEDAMEENELGPVDLDDEDPDTEDWDDMRFGDEEGTDGLQETENVNDNEQSEKEKEVRTEDDNDAFMDDDTGSSDDSDEDRNEDDIDEEEAFFEGAATFDEEEHDGDSDDDEDYKTGALNNDDLEFVDNESSSSEDEIAPQIVRLPSSAQSSDAFAPAEDYQELIEKSWNKQKRPHLQDETENSFRKKGKAIEEDLSISKDHFEMKRKRSKGHKKYSV